jgi:hypothetical protein
MGKVAGKIIYAVAALFLAYAVWELTRSMEAVSEAIEAGHITFFGNFYEVINFYMATTGQYFAYTFLLAGMGILLHKVGKATPQVIETSHDLARAESDSELDEWFNEKNDKEEE